MNPIEFCRDYFMLDQAVVDSMRGRGGAGILHCLWHQFADKIYESPLYLLRNEIYRSEHIEDPLVRFLETVDAPLLDYGCGTGEASRLNWIEQGKEALLCDPSRVAKVYRDFKYEDYGLIDNVVRIPTIPKKQYRSIICIDVLEHVSRPLEITRFLHKHSCGDILFNFNRQIGISGHLQESINQYENWLGLLEELFVLVSKMGDYIWVKKREPGMASLP